MNKIGFLKYITENFKDKCVITTQEVYENRPMVGKYYFENIDFALAFFTEEYNDLLIRKVHNTQITSWNIVYESYR
jgi:hypothetical protein